MLRMLRHLPIAAVFTLMALMLCHSWHGPDIWYHLTWGRELVEQGHWWPAQRTLLVQPVPANVYWLFQGAVYSALRVGGVQLVSAVFGLLWSAIALLWLHLSGGFSRPVAGAWALLAFVLCNQLRFEHRPEVLSYLFIMLSMHLLTRPRLNLAALFFLQVLWTNTHGYFALGVLLAAAFLAAQAIEPTAGWRKASAAVLVTLAGSFVTPGGWGAWMSVWHNARVAAGLRDLNAELMAPSLWPPTLPWTVFAAYWLVTGVLAVRALWRRQQVFAALAALGGATLSAEAVRNLPLLVLMSAPLLRTLPAGPARLRAVPAALVFLLSVWLATRVVSGEYHRDLGSLSGFGVRLERASYPVEATEFLRQRGFSGRIFTDSYDGGYVEYHLPEVTVAGDSYFSDPDITREFYAAIKEPDALARLHQRFAFDALLVNVENLEVLDRLLNDPNWSVVFTDSHRAVFFPSARSPAVPLSAGRYHWGDDLRRWPYAFGPISWMAVARKRNDRALVAKIISDVTPAPVIPFTLYKMALAYAVSRHDRDLVRTILPLEGKLDGAEPGDQAEIEALQAEARRCCL